MTTATLIQNANNEMAEIAEEVAAKGSYCEFCTKKVACSTVYAKRGMGTRAWSHHLSAGLDEYCTLERWAYEKHFKVLGHELAEIGDWQGVGIIATKPIKEARRIHIDLG